MFTNNFLYSRNNFNQKCKSCEFKTKHNVKGIATAGLSNFFCTAKLKHMRDGTK